MSLEQLVICLIFLIMTINSMSGSLVCSGGIALRQRVMDLAGFCAVCCGTYRNRNVSKL